MAVEFRISSNGFRSKTTRSASFPGSIEPRSCSRPMAWAPRMVAARSASCLDMPPDWIDHSIGFSAQGPPYATSRVGVLVVPLLTNNLTTSSKIGSIGRECSIPPSVVGIRPNSFAAMTIHCRCWRLPAMYILSASMNPGTMVLPVTSMTRALAGLGLDPAGPTATIRSSRITTSAFSMISRPFIVMARAPRSTRLCFGVSRRAPIRIRCSAALDESRS